MKHLISLILCCALSVSGTYFFTYSDLKDKTQKMSLEYIEDDLKQTIDNDVIPVSYTHLTLPTTSRV